MTDSKSRAAFMSKLAAAGSYPAILAIGFALHGALMAAGWSVVPAAYAAVVAGAALITLHELALPYRREWRPSARETRADALFLATVQAGVPYLLSLSLALYLSRSLEAAGFNLPGFWPHAWPVFLQAALMLATADFLRYWLHRAFHRFPFMWAFHAVHHSPHRLYWLNVGRFHPLEKAVQYLADALPFVLLGVSPEVLSAYLVFYAINGFFQHSNCRVRLGPLNYIVAGPELHRWHHSAVAAESGSNFGNNLIVWDLLFGTRWLPEDREVGPLGLVNRAYPQGFLAQMKTPFIKGLDQGAEPAGGAI